MIIDYNGKRQLASQLAYASRRHDKRRHLDVWCDLADTHKSV